MKLIAEKVKRTEIADRRRRRSGKTIFYKSGENWNNINSETFNYS